MTRAAAQEAAPGVLYVYVKDGAAKSQADFDAFSLEFAKEPGRRPQLQLERRVHHADERQDVREHLPD